jgi:hypothetical protein
MKWEWRQNSTHSQPRYCMEISRYLYIAAALHQGKIEFFSMCVCVWGGGAWEPAWIWYQREYSHPYWTLATQQINSHFLKWHVSTRNRSVHWCHNIIIHTAFILGYAPVNAWSAMRGIELNKCDQKGSRILVKFPNPVTLSCRWRLSPNNSLTIHDCLFISFNIVMGCSKH